MRILIVSAAFFPENSPRSFRASELAKEFARIGHSVTVLVPGNMETLSYCKSHGIEFKALPNSYLPKVKIAKSKLFNLVTRALSRLLLLLVEYPEIEYMWQISNALKRELGYDILISLAVPYPVHWGVAWSYNSKLAKCWVADCGDPYVGNQSDSFRKPFYFHYIERWMFGKSTFVTIPLDAARTAYGDYVQSKIRVIPQGLRFENFHISLKAPKHSVPTFAYAGSFIPGKRDPIALISYLISQKVEYRFEIFTATPSVVEELAKESRGKIQIHGIIPREELIARLSQMDFLLFIQNSTPTQMPSKLIDYYLAGRPVLSLTTDCEDFAVLDEFLNGDYKSKMILEGYDRFRIENVAKQFLALLKEGNQISL